MLVKREVFDYYLRLVAYEYDMYVDHMMRSTDDDAAEARRMLSYLCFKRPMSLKIIEQLLRDYGYTKADVTVWYMVERFKTDLKHDKDLEQVVKRIEQFGNVFYGKYIISEVDE